jgi:hypothetical protein
MPALLRVSHAPAMHCTFKPLNELDLEAAADEQLHCQLLLGKGSYIQRFVRLELEGSIRNTGGGGAGRSSWGGGPCIARHSNKTNEIDATCESRPLHTDGWADGQVRLPTAGVHTVLGLSIVPEGSKLLPSTSAATTPCSPWQLPATPGERATPSPGTQQPAHLGAQQLPGSAASQAALGKLAAALRCSPDMMEARRDLATACALEVPSGRGASPSSARSSSSSSHACDGQLQQLSGPPELQAGGAAAAAGASSEPAAFLEPEHSTHSTHAAALLHAGRPSTLLSMLASESACLMDDDSSDDGAGAQSEGDGCSAHSGVGPAVTAAAAAAADSDAAPSGASRRSAGPPADAVDQASP